MPRVHKRFLNTLTTSVPAGCRPIVVTDGRVKTPWFDAVAELGWDWLGRVRGTVKLTRPSEKTWIRCTTLMALLNAQPCTVYGLKKTPQQRVDKTARGVRALSKRSRVNAAREKEPWLMATSLAEEEHMVAAVIHAYRKRM